MYTCELNIYGVCLRVKSEQSEAIQRLRTMLGLFVLPDGTIRGNHVDWVNEANLDILDFLSRKDMYGFHASSYENKKGKGILLPGRKASGKTTIAFSALSAGYPVVGDDVVIYRCEGNDLDLLPFKSYFLLKDNGKVHIYDVLEHYPRNVFRNTNARLIVFPSIKSNEATELKEIDDRKSIISKLIENFVWIQDPVFRKKQASVLERFCKLPAYDLSLGTDHKREPQIAIELLDEL
jgi:hypothetical protein